MTLGIEPSLGLVLPPNYGDFSALLLSSDFLCFRSDFRSSFLASSLVSTLALDDSSLAYGLTTVELPGLPSAVYAVEFPVGFSNGCHVGRRSSISLVFYTDFSVIFVSSFFSYPF